MDKVKLGIIGLGNMGTPVSQWIISNNMCPEIEAKAICDKKADRIEWDKKAYDGKEITYFTDAEEMMNSGLIDAVYIAVPHYDHPVLAMKAFSKGLHVMLEKPAAFIPRR